MSKTVNPSYQQFIDEFPLKRSQGRHRDGKGKTVVLELRLRVRQNGAVFLEDGSQPSGRTEPASSFADLVPGLELLIARAAAEAARFQAEDTESDE